MTDYALRKIERMEKQRQLAIHRKQQHDAIIRYRSFAWGGVAMTAIFFIYCAWGILSRWGVDVAPQVFVWGVATDILGVTLTIELELISKDKRLYSNHYNH